MVVPQCEIVLIEKIYFSVKAFDIVDKTHMLMQEMNVENNPICTNVEINEALRLHS